jgi:hypothetical protein
LVQVGEGGWRNPAPHASESEPLPLQVETLPRDT